METIENANGVESSIPPAPEKEYLDKEDLVEAAKPAKSEEKPWIKAGFKSRAEWRASKKSAKVETTATEKTEKTEKPVKKEKKTAKPAVKTAASKAKAPKKPAKKPKMSAKNKKTEKTEKRGRRADRKYKPHRTEPSEMQKKLLTAFGGVGKVGELKSLGEKAFKSAPAKKRFSWARNNVRWLFANKFVSHVAPGQYKRLK